MPFIVGIFEPTDHRCRGADDLRELRLSQSCLRPKSMNLPRDLFVCARLLQSCKPLGFAFIESVVQDFHSVVRSLLSAIGVLKCMLRWIRFTKKRFRRIARFDVAIRTAFSFTSPCATTAATCL
jgi:hypothetical protein